MLASPHQITILKFACSQATEPLPRKFARAQLCLFAVANHKLAMTPYSTFATSSDVSNLDWNTCRPQWLAARLPSLR